MDPRVGKMPTTLVRLLMVRPGFLGGSRVWKDWSVKPLLSRGFLLASPTGSEPRYRIERTVREVRPSLPRPLRRNRSRLFACPVGDFGIALNLQRLSLSYIGFRPLAPRRAPSAPRDDKYQTHRHPGRSRLHDGLADPLVSIRSLTERTAAPRCQMSVCTRRQTVTRKLLRITHNSESAHRAGALRVRGGVCLSDERVNSPFRHNALTGCYARERIHNKGFECLPVCTTFHQFSVKPVLSAS